MNSEIFKLFFKEWFRTGGIRKIIQLIIILIVPVTFLMITSVLPSIILQNNMLPINVFSFVIFLVSAIYSIYYLVESDEKIMNGFPTTYISVKMSTIYTIYLIFTFLISLIILYFSIFASIFIVNQFTINDIKILSFSKMFLFISPLIIGLPYMVFTGILIGSLIGIIGKKVADNFSENGKSYFIKFYFILIFLSTRGYFMKIWNIIQANNINEKLFIYSPIYLASIISHLFIGKTSFLYLIFSLFINIIFFIFFVFICDKKIVFSLSNNINFGFNKREISFISPIWNLIIKRFLTLPVIIFLIIWMSLTIINKFYFESVNLQMSILNLASFIYTFIVLDKMFPKSKEDYRFLWISTPISKKHIEGVFLGYYYILYFIPIMIYNKLSIIPIMQTRGIVFPLTLTGYMLKIFPLITITAIIPYLIYKYPYLWSTNENDKKLLKKNAIFTIIFVYFIITGIYGICAGYITSEGFRVFINKLFWNNGYIIGKILFYSFSFGALIIHIRSLFLLVLSFIYKK